MIRRTARTHPPKSATARPLPEAPAGQRRRPSLPVSGQNPVAFGDATPPPVPFNARDAPPCASLIRKIRAPYEAVRLLRVREPASITYSRRSKFSEICERCTLNVIEFAIGIAIFAQVT